MKRIALFGGSGRTGQQFLKQALQKAYPIKALIRTPSKFEFAHDNLNVIHGDVLNPEDVERTVAGTDIVVSLFGHVKNSPKWLQSDGTQNIVAAMEKNRVSRIISLSGGGLPFPEKDQPKLIDHLIRGIMRITVPAVLNDAVKHYEKLKNSDLKWTIVRAPRLTNGPKTGDYKVTWVGVNSGTKVSRADLADFILQQVEDETYIYSMPFISY